MLAQSDRKQEIQRIAAELFHARGFDGVSVRDLANAAGITLPTLYWYIGSKQQLLVDLLQSIHERMYERFSAIAASDAAPPDKLRSIIHAAFEMMADDPTAYSLAHREHRSIDSQVFRQIAPTRRQLDGIVRGVIEEGRALGLWQRVSPDVANLAVWSVIRFAPEWFRPGLHETPPELAEGFATVLLDGLNASDASRPRGTSRGAARPRARRRNA